MHVWIVMSSVIESISRASVAEVVFAFSVAVFGGDHSVCVSHRPAAELSGDVNPAEANISESCSVPTACVENVATGGLCAYQFC